jgi:hypothetical protein
MRGQKRVEDARERAYDPRIHLLRKNFLQRWMDCRVKPGNDGTGISANAVATVAYLLRSRITRSMPLTTRARLSASTLSGVSLGRW